MPSPSKSTTTPVVCGDITIESLGKVVFDKPAYHNQDIVFPVGFCSSCRFQSVVNPTTKCRYTSEVLDGGSKPIFRVTCEDDESG
eukprot:CAMPEP_0113709626 /NCGR_PEP_ID=MMETSP0038_2-20120614/29682_1 /TAXON_ID=2898 /ORGANISM="Cryptomonas paramecium" /LENGTH=84 /DNA_ID=CAMNT_0000635545 /DNA_START=323 /DNA_END=574 /DNA_ORIENTATION=+ /assembly_acc=CAM_ASM_000170